MLPENDFTIAGITYYLEWDKLNIGGSFFLPCLSPARAVQGALTKHTRKAAIKLHTQNRCEYGRYGVRVWRIA